LLWRSLSAFTLLLFRINGPARPRRPARFITAVRAFHRAACVSSAHKPPSRRSTACSSASAAARASQRRHPVRPARARRRDFLGQVRQRSEPPRQFAAAPSHPNAARFAWAGAPSTRPRERARRDPARGPAANAHRRAPSIGHEQRHPRRGVLQIAPDRSAVPRPLVEQPAPADVASAIEVRTPKSARSPESGRHQLKIERASPRRSSRSYRRPRASAAKNADARRVRALHVSDAGAAAVSSSRENTPKDSVVERQKSTPAAARRFAIEHVGVSGVTAARANKTRCRRRYRARPTR